MCDGKAATRSLRAGLAKGPLQLRRIWHRAAGAVHHPHSMAVPAGRSVDAATEPIADLFEQSLEQFQRQPAAGHTIGLRSHVLA